ncbi:hypothetical protein SAMN05421741_11352 [Paenimyroides ummariense]|uniref:Uncharacterized protein n=1 Tax=Paenimyroides ummariense TaxID=913024 RepID=A0A1I5CTC6_9FLAO|nr:hypothetical protein [Paenimyroides ummariense]SFN90177.1 hypothetical protein SAMN05421741_11352 [Paenimyroides ummariense]
MSSPGSVRKIVHLEKDTVISGISFTFDFLLQLPYSENNRLTSYFHSVSTPLWSLNKDEAFIVKQALTPLNIPGMFISTRLCQLATGTSQT